MFLRGPHLKPDDRTLLQATARSLFDAKRGSLTGQVDRQPELLPLPEAGRACAVPCPTSPQGARSRQPADLSFWNGRGGFSAGGREYVIQVKGRTICPRTWVNVIANRDFGFLVLRNRRRLHLGDEQSAISSNELEQRSGHRSGW